MTPQGSLVSGLLARQVVSGSALVSVLVGVEAADSLIHGFQDEDPVLGEQVAVDVLGGLDLDTLNLIGSILVRPQDMRLAGRIDSSAGSALIHGKGQ